MDQGVGREIKRLREERGWSLTKLAAEAAMSPSGVSMIESGQRNLTTTTLAKLADALGVEIADLFPKEQGALFSPDDPPVGRGADEAAAGLLRVLNEALHGMQQAYAPGREPDWDRETLEEISALVAKATLMVASAGFATGGNDSSDEAVQVLARGEAVVRLLDARAAEAPAQEAGPPPSNVIKLRREFEELRRSAEEHLERAG